ncbi:MAG TPA: extracellular solute-binding protein [Verrucomicrobiae bacterium]|nr:extracellular solute-binding protein [Verrucomicrobiae bacterium]
MNSHKPPSEAGYDSKKEFARFFATLSQVFPLWLVVLIAICSGLLLPVLAKFKSMSARDRIVIVYIAQDQVYAEPILKEFEKETGIKVKAVYDSEAVKTVGLANRLLAERDHPQCDVFWGNEELRTHQLAAQHVFRETNGWAAFGYRSRRIVINTTFVAAGGSPAVEGGILPPGSSSGTSPASITPDAVPSGGTPGSTAGKMPAATTLIGLTNDVWRGKVALAYPLFGTTATHFLALRQHWGDERWENWCRALHANKPFLVDGNSVVAKLVGKGEAWIGLTDSDDIAAERRNGAPVVAAPVTEESLLIPNTVGVTRGAPHPEAAQKLFDYLQQPEVVQKLVAVSALEGGSIQSVAVATLKPDWEKLVGDLDEGTATLKGIFLR